MGLLFVCTMGLNANDKEEVSQLWSLLVATIPHDFCSLLGVLYVPCSSAEN